MALVSSRALVLQTFAYGDTSKILRLYTLEYGLRSVIAKGAQRARSRYGGLLEPFTEGDAQFYLKEGRDLHTLGGFDLLRGRQALGRDLSAFAGASLLAEVVLRFGTEEAQPELFHLLTGSLDSLSDAPPETTGPTSLAALWQMISLLGFQPELGCCVRCGRVFDDDEPARFDVDAGGAACTLCRPTGRVVDARTRLQVGSMCEGLDAPPALSDASLHRALVRAFVGSHLAAEHPLRAMPLFLDNLR